MPCGCFGGGGGNVGKASQADGEKYKPKDTKQPYAPSPITTKPPPVTVDPIPNPVKAQPLNTSAPPTKPGAGSSPGNGDPDKANRRRDVVASYYSDECELLTYKTTDSRPSSQVEGGGGSSPPVATSSPTPSSPASTRSAASTRADLAEKRREFFKPLVGSELERSGGTLPPHHSHSLLEEHERQLEHYHEPTVKDQVHKFEHLPEDLQSPTGNSKRETEVRLGRNSRSTTVVISTGEKQQTSNHKQAAQLVSHIDNELSPEQQKQEQQLVNKAALHNQLLADGQVNLRPTPKQKEPSMPNMTFTAPDQPHDDNCIVQTTPAVTPTPHDDDDITAWVTPTPAKPPPKPAHLPPQQHDDHAQTYSPISEPTPIITEPKHLPAETESLLSETEPFLTETEPRLTETESLLTETEPLIRETEPLITETELVSQPQHIYTIPGPVVTEPQHVDIIPEHVIEPEVVFSQPEPVAQPEPFVVESQHKNATEHEPQHFTEFTHVEEPTFSLEKAAPVLESASDVTESFICETNDTKALASAVTEQISSDMEDAFIKQETELISVLEENKKNIISSQAEQMPFESHTEIKTEIIHSEPSGIIESNSDITKNQEIVSQMENVMHGSPQDCFGLSETTSNEENISIISKTEPIEVDHMSMDFTTGISQSEHLVSVNSSDEGTTHTEISKSIVTDEDGNTTIHTETLTTKTISSSELIPETLTTDPFSDRTMVCIRESSSLVDEESSESSLLVAESSPSDKVINPVTDIIHDDQQQQQPDIQSTLDSSLPPLTQIGSSPSPSSSSPRNSSHSSPSPPASPDSPRTHKLGMVELQYEQEPVAHQIEQEVQESKDHSNLEDHITHNSAVNNQDASKVHGVIDANLATGLPSLSLESPNPHTCNEADITAPASLEDDGLGSEIDDALDSVDCFSEEVTTHNNQHPHHQSVPAPPPPSSAS